MMKQFTRDQAIGFDSSNLSPTEKFCVQLEQELLCLPVDELYHSAREALGRPVFTHEFANRDDLVAEFERVNGETVEDVINRLPEEVFA